MAPEDQITLPESKAEAEALIPQFALTKVLNQDQNGRRISLLGQIQEQPALLVLERAAFSSHSATLQNLLTSLTHTTNLGANDVYRWYMANNTSSPSAAAAGQQSLSDPDQGTDGSAKAESTPVAAQQLYNVKVNLIWPATTQHVKKYTSQPMRYVTETSEIYKRYTRPLVQGTQRTQKRLDWIYNVLDGRTEQEDVVHRSVGLGICTKEDKSDSEGFLLLPDLNWDRRTVTGLHLLALVERRDLWSVRDLKKRDVPWLRTLREEIVEAAAIVAQGLSNAGGQAVAKDEFKCYIHYHPTYWHFHVHVVHVMLEAEGGTQSVGKAIGLENVISWLESMPEQKAMDDVDLSFFVGVESEIWKGVFMPLKESMTPTTG